ncbi:MAG: CPBP family intramembrane metalloprotease [Oscillospiraceae bacterium]|nr:CPBP family intramembrane metalloprotease [Oscillospiraceae bacterium]
MSDEYFYIVNDTGSDEIGAMPDPQDPFDNPSEFHSYQCDYGAVMPEIRLAGFRLPRLPDGRERSRIRRFHNIVGGFLMGHFVVSNALAIGMVLGIKELVRMVDRAAVGELPYNYNELLADYLDNSTMWLVLSMLVYGTCNVLVAVFGCKATRIPIPNLFRTKDLTPGLMFAYICAALCIQAGMGVAATTVVDLFDANGILLFDEADSLVPTSTRGIIVSFVYSVIVAPITEELLMRGFVLKNLSRSNQHFGIIMTAFIFGIWHENVPQFLLAFVAGCLFGYVAVRHDSLVPAIICHMSVNLAAEVLSFLYEHEFDLASRIGDFIYTALALIGLVVIIKLLIVDRFPRATVAQQERGVRIALSSPLILLIIICHIGSTVLYILRISGIVS